MIYRLWHFPFRNWLSPKRAFRRFRYDIKQDFKHGKLKSLFWSAYYMAFPIIIIWAAVAIFQTIKARAAGTDDV